MFTKTYHRCRSTYFPKCLLGSLTQISFLILKYNFTLVWRLTVQIIRNYYHRTVTSFRIQELLWKITSWFFYTNLDTCHEHKLMCYGQISLKNVPNL